MYRTVLDAATTAVWGVSAINTVTDLDLVSASGIAQFALAVLGVVWTIVRIANDYLNGRLNREQTRLENDRLELENLDLSDDFDAFSRNEKDN